MVHDPLVALETLISLGFERVLTSGCDSSALEGLSLIKRLAEQVSVCCAPLGYCGCSPGTACRQLLYGIRHFWKGTFVKECLPSLSCLALMFPQVQVGWAPKSPTAKAG